MRQAAQGLRSATKGGRPSLAKDGPPDGTPGEPNPDPQSQAGGHAEADLSRLQDLVRSQTGRRWGELPGHLRTEILQMTRGRYRDDYARLIQLYFQEIAAGANAGGDPPGP